MLTFGSSKPGIPLTALKPVEPKPPAAEPVPEPTLVVAEPLQTLPSPEPPKVVKPPPRPARQSSERPGNPMDHREARRMLVKTLQQLGDGRRALYDVFRDFVEISAIVYSNQVDLRRFNEREARYMDLIKRYEGGDLTKIAQCMAFLVIAYEHSYADVLGSVFGELELHNAARGQFFTPYELCVLMARMNINKVEVRQMILDKGFVTFLEPSCGAGAQIVAMAEAMWEAEFNPTQHMHVTAWDIDERAAHMCYIQLTLIGVPAVIIVGNSLSQEIRDVWYTPTHIIGGWTTKLRRGFTLDSDKGKAYMEQPANVCNPEGE